MLNLRMNLWFLVPSMLFIAVAGALVLLLPNGEELYALNSLRVEPWNTLMRTITWLGEWPIWLGLILYWGWKSHRFALAIGIGSLMLMGFNYLLKETTKKPRPISWARQQDARQLVFVPEEYVNSADTSFPSGHTASAFAVFFLISHITAQHKYAWFGLPAAALAIAVGISRIFLVQHFLADVIAGAIIGLSFGLLIWIIGSRWLSSL